MSMFVGALITAVLLGGLLWLVARLRVTTARTVWTLVLAAVLGSGIAMMDAHAFVAKWGFRGDSPRDGLLYLMDGTASRPFVYRRLTPELIRVATAAGLRYLPPQTIDYLVNRSALLRHRGYWAGEESWNPRKAIAFHCAYLVLIVALFGTFVAAAALVETVTGSSLIFAVISGLLGLAFVPVMYSGGGYLYDAPELFLCTLLLLAVCRGWWFLVPVMFALLIVNKESGVLVLLVLLPILYRAQGPRAAVIWCVMLGLLSVAWVVYVRQKYALAAGEPMEWWFPSNLQFWSSPHSYFLVDQTFAPAVPSPRSANVLILLLLLLPARFGWPSLRPDLRWGLVLLAAPLVALFVVGGYRDEIRNLSLLFPLIFLLCVEGVRVMFRPELGPHAAKI
jgi:hypothetical protein